MTHNELLERANKIWDNQVEEVHDNPDGSYVVELAVQEGDVRRSQYPIGSHLRYYFHNLDPNGHPVCHDECKEVAEREPEPIYPHELLDLDNERLGSLLREYLIESDHEGWDGHPEADQTAYRALFTDIKKFSESFFGDEAEYKLRHQEDQP